MKKIVLFALVVILAAVALCGCRQVGNRVVNGRDVQTFGYAYIALGGEKIVSGRVEQWRDYENSDTVQVKIDGKYYLTHYANVVLVADSNSDGTGSADVNWMGKKE